MSEIDWHREMLADLDRVNAFRTALSEAVHPGDVVLDIGTGTGLLAIFAIQLGASRVYAIEQGDIVNVAEEVVAKNGISNEQIRFLKGHSSQVELPERVDLVVAELIGSFGLEESIIPVLSDARERFLKPGGRLLPSWLDLYVAPTEEGEIQGRWQRVLAAEHGLDLRLCQICPSTVRSICGLIHLNSWLKECVFFAATSVPVPPRPYLKELPASK